MEIALKMRKLFVPAAILVCAVLHFGAVQAADLFTFVTNADLTPDQQATLKALSAVKAYTSVSIVRANPNALDAHELALPLPMEGGVTTVDPNSIHTAGHVVSNRLELSGTVDRSAGDQAVWKGQAAQVLSAGGTSQPSSAIFTAIGGKVSGSIITPKMTYRLQPMPGGLNALIAVDPSKLPPEEPHSDASPDLPDLPPMQLREAADTSIANITVLVAATRNGAVLAGDLGLYAANAISESNQAFANSGIRIRFTLAGTYIDASTAESGNMVADVDKLANPHDKIWDAVGAERDKDRADLVVMITDDEDYCGYAKQIGAVERNAYAINYEPCGLSPTYSFEHETGHLLGACHNIEASASCPTSDGHGYIDVSHHDRDIMAYDCDQDGGNCPRMPMFSRPPNFGVVGRSNAARVIDGNGPREAKFYPAP
jgi:hypothetical protein